MPYVLGIDVGTTQVKACVINERGRIISSSLTKSKIIISSGSKVEQDPEDIWISVVKAIRKAVSTRKLRQGINAVSLSTQGGTLIPTGKDGTYLRPAITWMDKRAVKEGKRITKKHGAKFFYERTGWIPDTGSLPLAQILWLRQNEKNIFKRTDTYHFVDSFLTYKLTERYCTDPSNAAITMLYEVNNKDWEKDLLHIAGIKIGQLPEIVSSGQAVGKLTSRASQTLGLSRETVLYSGGHDQYCAALGTGAIEPGEILLSAGTAWVILSITKKPVFHFASRLAPVQHVVKDRWGALISIPAAGACLEWLRGNVYDKKIKKGFGEINRIVKDIAAGSENLLFLPHFYEGRGTFIGLSLSHSAGHLFRALMEGLAYEVRCKLERIRKAGISFRELRMIGGGARSPIWPSIIADVTGLPTIVGRQKEVGSLGAAFLAGLGMGIFEVSEIQNFVRVDEKIFLPDKKRKILYEKLFKAYKEAFCGLGKCYGILKR